MTSRWRPCSLTAWIPRMMKDLSPTLVSIRSMDEPHLMFFVHIRFVNSVCLFHMSLFVCAQTKKNPHHSALCTLYHQLDLKNTNKPKNMCMRVSMFACPFLQHYTRKKKKPTNSRMSNVWSLHGDCVLFTRRLSPIHLKLNENRVRPAPDERSCRLRLNSK